MESRANERQSTHEYMSPEVSRRHGDRQLSSFDDGAAERSNGEDTQQHRRYENERNDPAVAEQRCDCCPDADHPLDESNNWPCYLQYCTRDPDARPILPLHDALDDAITKADSDVHQLVTAFNDQRRSLELANSTTASVDDMNSVLARVSASMTEMRHRMNELMAVANAEAAAAVGDGPPPDTEGLYTMNSSIHNATKLPRQHRVRQWFDDVRFWVQGVGWSRESTRTVDDLPYHKRMGGKRRQSQNVNAVDQLAMAIKYDKAGEFEVDRTSGDTPGDSERSTGGAVQDQNQSPLSQHSSISEHDAADGAEDISTFHQALQALPGDGEDLRPRGTSPGGSQTSIRTNASSSVGGRND
ncbi:uncharacterized protein LTR77_011049 [Saxophila tyrrhenica]|uniref:Uncharacterized protein n=1 Tax=Saxophila tyrrhenica TaxID=1690608 RepID=A0AAV9NUR2_9PEZI|nr:hypothetical protein LTR77_011049 [Saxophila tyrrhenica]